MNVYLLEACDRPYGARFAAIVEESEKAAVDRFSALYLQKQPRTLVQVVGEMPVEKGNAVAGEWQG